MVESSPSPVTRTTLTGPNIVIEPDDVLNSVTMSVSDRPSDAALWAAMADALRATVLPNLTDPFARNVTIQLIGLASYAGRRGSDPTKRRQEELSAALEGAAGQDVLRSCIAVLADPYHRAHTTIREILERHLEEDLENEAALLTAFRGQVPNG
jgi:hypothetical protein